MPCLVPYRYAFLRAARVVFRAPLHKELVSRVDQLAFVYPGGQGAEEGQADLGEQA